MIWVVGLCARWCATCCWKREGWCRWRMSRCLSPPSPSSSRRRQTSWTSPTPRLCILATVLTSLGCSSCLCFFISPPTPYPSPTSNPSHNKVWGGILESLCLSVHQSFCPDCLEFATKLGLIVNHHKLKHTVKILDCCVQSQGQGHGKGSKFQLLCVCSELLNLL